MKIGAVIETIMTAKNISKETIATLMGVTVRCVEKWLDSRFLPIQRMLKLSEVLGENLLLHYHPNVKPLPNPLQQELDKQISYVKNFDGMEERLNRTLTENIKLRAERDLLKEMLLEKNGR